MKFKQPNLQLLLIIIGLFLASFLLGHSVSSQVTVQLPNSCKGDYLADGTINISDLQVFAANYKKSNINCDLDIIGNNCFLNVSDLQSFAELYKVKQACDLATLRLKEVEEQTGWTVLCQTYTDGYPQVNCPAGIVSYSDTNKISGKNSLIINGTRENYITYSTTLVVKPNTTYKTSIQLKIIDRKTYNYLDLNFPTVWTQQRSGLQDNVEYTKGIWSGDYEIAVNGERINQPLIKDAPYRSASDVDWFPEDNYFKTGPEQTTVPMYIKLIAYQGTLQIDGINIEEVDSHLADSYFHIPIEQEFDGMKIVSVTQSPLSVKTNAAEFRFEGNKVTQLKGSVVVGNIIANQPIFNDLVSSQEKGLVILENSNVLISIGADSVMLVKLKTDAVINVTGPKEGYANFEAGVIFGTDFTQGILFSPLRTRQELTSIPFTLNPMDNSYVFSDTEIANKGLKFWKIISDFNQPSWNFEYTFKKGDGFISEVFPPKVSNAAKACKNIVTTNSLNINNDPQANYDYLLQDQKKWGNYTLVWMNNYESINDQNAPNEYCKDINGLLVACNSSQVAARVPVNYKFDVTGPYTISQKAAFHSVVDKAHAQNLKVIMYMSPQFYYTYNVDKFIGDLKSLVAEYSLDGVYYDGIFEGDPLKTLELVRKTRNALGSKFYVQHNSNNSGLIRKSKNFRTPYEDAYSDLIWLGEGVKAASPQIWKVNYCNQNVANTPSTLLAEYRPVDYTNNNSALSLPLTLSPEEQINRTLSCGGQFRISAGNKSSIIDARFQTQITYDTSLYLDKLRESCLPKICGDNVCDVIENINNCAKDCAPVTATSTVTKQGETFTCTSPTTVAQWVVDGSPLYSMHYTFDNNMVHDTSGNANDPTPELGFKYSPPDISTIDNQLAAHFTSNQIVYNNIYKQFDFTNKPISSFARIKRDDSNSNVQVLFYLGVSATGQNFYYGINQNKLYFWAKDGTNSAVEFKGLTDIDQNWHTVGFVYNNTNLTLYLDGQIDKQFTNVSFGSFPESIYFYFGAYGMAAGNPFRGFVDDFFISDKALTLAQVSEYAQTKLSKATFTNATKVNCITQNNSQLATATEK